MQIKTLYDLLSHQSQVSPDTLAVHSQRGARFSHSELIKLINNVAIQLRDAGIQPDDHIAVIVSDRMELALTCLAISCYCCCVPINPDLNSHDLEAIMGNIDLKALVHDNSIDQTILPIDEKSIFMIKTGAFDQSNVVFLPWVLSENVNDKALKYSDFFTRQERDSALLLHTSGSTALPKQVVITHRRLVESARNICKSLSLNNNDHVINMMPLFHIGGLLDLLIAPLSAGGSSLICDDMQAKTFFRYLAEFKPTWHQGVPTMLQDIEDHARQHEIIPDSHTLRFIRSVSSPMNEVLHDALEKRFGIPVIEIYGMTETTGVITSSPLPPGQRKSGSVGTSVGPRIKIINKDGNAEDIGKRGEIIVNGATVIHKDTEKPGMHSFIGEWLRTGDEGYIDSDGYLFITGRIKDIINRGGEKISPAEIDRIALQHPAVGEAASFSIPHATLGEDVAIAIVCKQSVSEQEIINHIAAQLAAFKSPRHVMFLDSLPRTAGGKLQRYKLTLTYNDRGSLNEGERSGTLTSTTSKLLASIWKKILGCSDIGLQDNFFDLGGDSLKAVQLVDEIEQIIDRKLPAGFIYDTQTLMEQAKILDQAIEETSEQIEENKYHDFLKNPAYNEISGYLMAWRGKRSNSNSLIVSRNTLSNKQPLFWCANSMHEFDKLSLGLIDRPLHAMISIGSREFRTQDNYKALSEIYVAEMLEIQPQGPYMIGGFCEGGKIAFEIAQQLRSKNLQVNLLCLQSQLIKKAYDGRIALFFSSFEGGHSPYRYFQQPEFGWSKLYKKGVSINFGGGKHGEYYESPHFDLFISQLKQEITAVERGQPSEKNVLLEFRSLNPVEIYQAKINGKTPFLMRALEKSNLEITVKNTSSDIWAPTKTSGITLSSRWLNRSGKQRLRPFSNCHLLEPLHPGESRKLSLEIQAPDKPGIRRLHIDMADEGICWFSEKGGQPLSKLVVILPKHGDSNRR